MVQPKNWNFLRLTISELYPMFHGQGNICTFRGSQPMSIKIIATKITFSVMKKMEKWLSINVWVQKGYCSWM